MLKKPVMVAHIAQKRPQKSSKYYNQKLLLFKKKDSDGNPALPGNKDFLIKANALNLGHSRGFTEIPNSRNGRGVHKL